MGVGGKEDGGVQEQEGGGELAQKQGGEEGGTFQLPEKLAAEPEVQEAFCDEHTAYPLNGRPFGLAFVWGSSYQDDSGAVQCMIATDSAAKVAEVLQQVGFEVRVRMNVRKKYLLDELAPDNIEEELKDKYDCVLCYFCGRGDGNSFLTQYNEIVTVREVWDLLGDVGFKNKPRLMVMDYFDVRSTYVEDEMEVLKTLEHDASEARADLDLLVAKGGSPPQHVVDHCESLEAQFVQKRHIMSTIRRPPEAGMQARIAIASCPIPNEGIMCVTFKVLSLQYAIGFGCCDAERISQVYGVGLRTYCGLDDFLGSDEHGWGFNHIGRAFHNEQTMPGKASWGKVAHVRAGDSVSVSVDTVQGIIRMEVVSSDGAIKFKGQQTKLISSDLITPEARKVLLHPAVALYGIGDSVEILEVQVGTIDLGPENDMGPFEGRVAWERRMSAGGLQCLGRKVTRGEGFDLPKDADGCIIMSRQPCQVAPKFVSERGNPSGEVFLSIYGLEPDEPDEGVSLFSHLFMHQLKQGLSDMSGQCFTEACVENIRREMDEYSLRAWLKKMSGLEAKNLRGLVVSMMNCGTNVNNIKMITEKGHLDDFGVKNRQYMDAIYQAVVEARNESSQKPQTLMIVRHCNFPGGKKLLLSIPPITWSMRHRSFNVHGSGSEAVKTGQSGVSCTVMCSLNGELRRPRQYGTLLAGGGKHSWTWTIKKLTSSQESQEGVEQQQVGMIRLGVVQVGAVRKGRYSISCGRCTGGTMTTVSLDPSISSHDDGFYEGMQVLITEGRGKGQISRIFGYTAEDCTIDVMLETDPDASSFYSITRLEGFEVGDDEYSWGVASSVSGRAAAMHGDPVGTGTSFKAFKYQGKPALVNRVTSIGFENQNSFPRFLGGAFGEGDTVTAYLDLEGNTLQFSVNNDKLGDAILGIEGPLVPALSVSSTTDCVVEIGKYRRWAPQLGWAQDEEAEMGLEEDELETIKEVFKSSERAGTITIKDLRECLTKIGWIGTDAEMQSIADQVDIDGSGTLDQTEWFQLVAGMKDEGAWSLDMARDKQRRTGGRS